MKPTLSIISDSNGHEIHASRNVKRRCDDLTLSYTILAKDASVGWKAREASSKLAARVEVTVKQGQWVSDTH